LGTAIKHPVPDRVKPLFVIFDIGHSDQLCQNYKWRLNPVWHRMLYSCTHVATAGVKGLIYGKKRIDYTVMGTPQCFSCGTTDRKQAIYQ